MNMPASHIPDRPGSWPMPANGWQFSSHPGSIDASHGKDVGASSSLHAENQPEWSALPVQGRSTTSESDALYVAAIVRMRFNPHLKALYFRLLLAGKSKMSALGGAMRILAHLCFGVFKTRSPYRADYA